jgi:hypothetical protein
MSISRRNLLVSAGVLGAVSSLPTLAQSPQVALVIFDSRIPESLAFAKERGRVGMETIDIGAKGVSALHVARQAKEASGEILGLTGWTDWVMLRGLLEEHGKRLTRELRVPHLGSRPATPFEWAMA